MRPAAAELNALSATAFERQTRWLVRVDGFDHGPFTPEEVRERIRDGRLTLLSEISEERDGRWFSLEDIQPFKAFCDQLLAEAAERARIEEIDRAETQVRRTHRFAWSVSHFGLAGVLLLAAVVAFALSGSRTVQPTNYKSVFFADELGRIEPWAHFSGEREHEWRFGGAGGAVPKAAAKKAAPRKPRRVSAGQVYEDTGDAEEAVSIDFTNDEATDLPLLSDQDIHELVVPTARKLLERCLIAEAARRSGVHTMSFRFGILPTGRVTGARVIGAATGEMHACAKRALRSIRLPAFRGGARFMTLALEISWQ